VISKSEGVKMMRNYQKPNERLYRRQKGYVYPRGSTEVIAETKKLFATKIVVEEVSSSSSSSSSSTAAAASSSDVME
jgi:hypothetical protein